MRYYTWVEPKSGDDPSPVYVTWSEEEIREKYYPYWYGRMCEKFGKDEVDDLYTFEDCLDDFVVTNWAEVSEQ